MAAKPKNIKNKKETAVSFRSEVILLRYASSGSSAILALEDS